jgi:ADP-ribose pyrophosphatase YjhB (NUDIX family)
MPRTTETDRISPRAAFDEQTTGTVATDEHYDLLSVFYHCLKAADACAQYIVDAEDAGDDELAEFFESARLQHNRLANEARELLVQRLAEVGSASDDE